MFRVSSTTTSKKNVAQNFLEFAVRNYLSARILYLNNQLYDAGVMSHEAFEKIMKALLYFKDPSLDLSSQHNLTNLINSLIGRFRVHDLKGSHDLFEYYENCYAYRYPDDNQPKSFSTSTDSFKSLDNIFFYFHEECLKEIANDDIKYLTGVFTEATHYFKSNDRRDLYKIIQSNDCFTVEYINVAKDYWHEKGYYLKDANGVTLYPNGSVIREH